MYQIREAKILPRYPHDSGDGRVFRSAQNKVIAHPTHVPWRDARPFRRKTLLFPPLTFWAQTLFAPVCRASITHLLSLPLQFLCPVCRRCTKSAAARCKLRVTLEARRIAGLLIELRGSAARCEHSPRSLFA